MEIVLEKSQVVDLRLDLHKQGISIGDDLDLVVNDQDQFILYFEPKRTIWSRFFYKLVPKVFGRLHPNAMKVVGNADRQETGRWCNNRAENSHLPFRRRERAMLRFRQMRCLQKFAAVHSSVHNHFNQERHFYSRDNFKLNRTAALAEWRQLLSA